MNKTLIALFSVSITAGTSYLVYTTAKSGYINRLVGKWKQAAKTEDKTLDEKQQEKLKTELDKFNGVELWKLADFSEKYLAKAPAAVLEALDKKRGISALRKKADLEAASGIGLPALATVLTAEAKK